MNNGYGSAFNANNYGLSFFIASPDDEEYLRKLRMKAYAAKLNALQPEWNNEALNVWIGLMAYAREVK